MESEPTGFNKVPTTGLEGAGDDDGSESRQGLDTCCTQVMEILISVVQGKH